MEHETFERIVSLIYYISDVVLLFSYIFKCKELIVFSGIVRQWNECHGITYCLIETKN